MPSFVQLIQLIQLIFLFSIAASTVKAVGTGDFGDAENEHDQAQEGISRIVRALRTMSDRSTPEFCSGCAQGIGSINPPSNTVQFEYAQEPPRNDLTKTRRYFRAVVQRLSAEKYGGNPIPKQNHLTECTSLLRGNLLQHLRTQYSAFQLSDPKLDVMQMAYGNRNWGNPPEVIIVALQQFIAEIQKDSERYSCNEFIRTDGTMVMNNVNDSSSSSPSDPTL